MTLLCVNDHKNIHIYFKLQHTNSIQHTGSIVIYMQEKYTFINIQIIYVTCLFSLQECRGKIAFTVQQNIIGIRTHIACIHTSQKLMMQMHVFSEWKTDFYHVPFKGISCMLNKTEMKKKKNSIIWLIYWLCSRSSST